ncbi:hypothetical protein, partial [Streptomyces sp. NPDC058092]|uniref:hypothetical protein n=1 Tax=Streptomyces sp. NPDC058092 TaxID=3346336 RepID=UPI0036F09BC0
MLHTPGVGQGCGEGAREGTAGALRQGLAALAQWVEREGADRPVPREHSEQITVDGETGPREQQGALEFLPSPRRVRRQCRRRGRSALLDRLEQGAQGVVEGFAFVG